MITGRGPKIKRKKQILSHFCSKTDTVVPKLIFVRVFPVFVSSYIIIIRKIYERITYESDHHIAFRK